MPTLKKEIYIILKHYSIIIYKILINIIKLIKKNKEEIISRLQSNNIINIKKLKISYIL